MAKKTEKRRAESMMADTSLTQQKKRVKSGLESYESSDEHEESLPGTSMAAIAHPRMLNGTHKSDSAKLLRVTSYEDAASLDSQRFLDFVKYGSKNEESIKRTNKYLEEFKRTIHLRAKDLTGEISRLAAQASSRDMGFSENFRIAYSPILSNNITAPSTREGLGLGSSRYDECLHQKSAEVLSCATSLVNQLGKSHEKLQAQEMSFTVNTEWQEDIHQMKHILDIGRRVGVQKVETILTGVGQPLLDVKSAEVSQLLYDKYSRPVGSLTWNDVVRKQEKAVMRLVNTLPWE